MILRLLRDSFNFVKYIEINTLDQVTKRQRKQSKVIGSCVFLNVSQCVYLVHSVIFLFLFCVTDEVMGILRDKTNDSNVPDCVSQRKEEARVKRRKKKTATSLVTSCFQGMLPDQFFSVP